MPYRAEDFERGCLKTSDGWFFSWGPTWAFNPKVTLDDYAADLNAEGKKGADSRRDYGNMSPGQGSQDFLRSKKLVRASMTGHCRVPYDKNGAFHSWFHPVDADYYAHLDMSAKKDSTGIAVCHLGTETCGPLFCEKCRKHPRLLREGLDPRPSHRCECVGIWENKVVYDLVMRRVPPGGDEELRFRDTRQIVIQMEAMGFYFKVVSTDQWQSRETHQVFEELGIESKLLSVDRNTVPWDTWLDLLCQGELVLPNMAIIEKEANELQIVKKGPKGFRVDHPADGSKDVMDAIVGATVHAAEDRPLIPEVGYVDIA